ncbi:unnamed protein product [Brachionus calyciflorus]|uniref:Uncharacterized protein n=1 Tax=Brachionus calyciflorus TaxID=104777 RepID=A0A813RL27_9BILA|nr:unnamed protein product [Brachionus calyciflorus]
MEIPFSRYVPDSIPVQNDVSKSVKFSKLRKSRHSVGNCEDLFQKDDRPKLPKSKSLLDDLHHLETKSSGFLYKNNKVNLKPLEPIITFPDEPEPPHNATEQIVPFTKKPLKTILKNRQYSPNLPDGLPFPSYSNFTVTRETQVTFPDDQTRTFKNYASKGKFLDSLNCDESCSSSFSSNFGHAYIHRPKSQYLIEPKRRWSYDYVNREPSDILNPDIDSRYLITESKLLNSKMSTEIEKEPQSKIFTAFTTLAQFIYVLITNFKYLFIFFLAATCCLLALSLKILIYFLKNLKSVYIFLIAPLRFLILKPITAYLDKRITERRKFKNLFKNNLNSTLSLNSEVSNGFLPLISDDGASSLSPSFDLLNQDSLF